tara:strand:- start:969 stop:1157 length:189 start_codon:yes stop_codon:yes gene_type:complete
MSGTNEIKVSTQKGETTWEATASLEHGERLHVEPSDGGFTFFVSKGGEVCRTQQEAKDLNRE